MKVKLGKLIWPNHCFTFELVTRYIQKLPVSIFCSFFQMNSFTFFDIQEKALEQLKITEGKTVAVGQKMDLVFHTLQIGFFHMDFDLISKSIDKAKK